MSVNEPIVSHRPTVMGSERGFGLVMAAFFLLVAVIPILHGGKLHLWALGFSAAFFLCAFAAPRLLSPLNRIWHRLGMALHAVINPIIMGLIFYGAIVPTGTVLRLLGKDLLRLTWKPDVKSYWIPREPPGPEPGSMSKQF
jgi:Saxitoxin biosynthesis operon protein SxtJ